MKRIKNLLSVLLAFMIMLPLAAQEERTIKRKVAIGRFSNETQYAKGLFYDKENDPMRKQALDILSSKLASSGKFILLEREDLDILVNEAGADMNKIGADYIILGSITEFGRKTEGEQKVFSSTKTQTVEAGVSIRLVEASTGLIREIGNNLTLARFNNKQTDCGALGNFCSRFRVLVINATLFTVRVRCIINLKVIVFFIFGVC